MRRRVPNALVSLLDTESDITDTPEVIAKYGDCMNPKRENWEDIRGDIEFRNVSFAYNGGEKVLKDFSLVVKQGETIALVGETGAGKSTIVNLVCRFYEPTEGSILIDGTDYRKRSQLWLQDRLGYVLQTPHLFSGSIRDNIRYGKKDASDEEVRAAAKRFMPMNSLNSSKTAMIPKSAKAAQGFRQVRSS